MRKADACLIYAEKKVLIGMVCVSRETNKHPIAETVNLFGYKDYNDYFNTFPRKVVGEKRKRLEKSRFMYGNPRFIDKVKQLRYIPIHFINFDMPVFKDVVDRLNKAMYISMCPTLNQMYDVFTEESVEKSPLRYLCLDWNDKYDTRQIDSFKIG